MEVEIRANSYHQEEKRSSSDNESPNKLDQSIKIIIEREGFITYTIEKQCISTNGGNYLGNLYEIDVKGNTNDGEKEINIFVKQIINMASSEILCISDVYNTEIFFYKELSKIFEEMQELTNVPVEARYKIVKVYDESDTKDIIMENLARKGYTTWYRMDSMSLQFVEEAVKNLARFHALSFALRETRPEYFANKIKSLKHPMNFEDSWEDIVKKSRDTLLGHIDEEYKEKVNKIYKDLTRKYASHVQEPSIRACLCHGDYRSNNILVKLDEEGVVQDLVPVDYQIMYHGSPVIDFIYLIYTGTDRPLRQAHLSDLKDLYYDTLTNFLKYFDLNADAVFSRKEFDKVFEERVEFGLTCGLLALIFIFPTEDQVLDISKGELNTSFRLDERFRVRFQGIMEDYEELGLI